MTEPVPEWTSRALTRIAAGTRVMLDELDLPRAPGLPVLDTFSGLYSLAERYNPNSWRDFQWIGFLNGRLWLLGELLSESRFHEAADVNCRRMAAQLADQPLTNENAGFDLLYGFCLGYGVTGDDWYRDQVLGALENYRRMFRPAVGLFLCDADSDEVVVDTAASFSVLFWASAWVPEYAEVMGAHMDRVLELGLVRPDGSVMQGAELDLESGQVRRLYARQGSGLDTRWTRAHAWVAHTYLNAFEVTRQERHLQVAERTAAYLLDHLPPSFVAPYDLDDPEPSSAPWDTCSSLMLANSLLRLERLGPAASASAHRRAAEGILETVVRKHLTYGGTVLHASWGNIRGSLGIGRFPQEDVLPYGNYFVVEALWRLMTRDWSPLALPASVSPPS